MSKRKRPPMQPVVVAEDGCIRFQENRMVQWMLEELRKRGITLNDAAIYRAREGVPRSDYEQLMQLIGYSVSGYGDLTYSGSVSKRSVEKADARADKLRSDAT